MTLAAPVAIRVNPNDSTQYYVLWGNGRVDANGGAVPITSGPTWYNRTDQPVAVDIHVRDWATGKAQIMDFQGAFHPLNGDTNYMDNSDAANPVNTLGLVYTPNRRYVRFFWDPSQPAQGYALDGYGQWFPFGGATVPPRGGPRFTTWAVRGADFSFAGGVKKAYMVDMSGAVWPDFSAVTPPIAAPYYTGQDVARDLDITDWTNGRGYTLTGDGAVHAFGGATASGVAGPYRAGRDVARILYVLSASDPVKLRQIQSGGEVFEYYNSTPPTVTAGGTLTVSPAASVTDTTRPVLSWTYSDPEQDSQAAWELYVYTAAWVSGHTMTDPSVWASNAVVAESGINPTTRGIESPVDLANGSYTMYVRAKDTAGNWSPWDDYAWTQAITPPATPTGLTATADNTAFTVALSVSATAGSYVRFEWTEDGGATVMPVRGAEQVTRTATTTATDYDIGMGATRQYRTVAYSTSPRTASVPSSWVSATMSAHTYALRVVSNPALGGAVSVQAPVEWTRPSGATAFQGLGTKYATVLNDGEPKARRTTINLIAETRAEWDLISALITAADTLVYRDPFGDVMYCRVVDDWRRSQLLAAPLLSESTPMRHSHVTSIPVVEVAPPILTV